MYYKWTKSQIAGVTAITLFVIFLFSMIVYQGYNQAEGKGTEVTGVVIEALISSNNNTLNTSMSIRAKIKSGKIVHVSIPIHPKITKGTKVIFKRYERALSGFNYRLYKYHTKTGLETIENPINEAY